MNSYISIYKKYKKYVILNLSLRLSKKFLYTKIPTTKKLSSIISISITNKKNKQSNNHSLYQSKILIKLQKTSPTFKKTNNILPFTFNSITIYYYYPYTF